MINSIYKYITGKVIIGGGAKGATAPADITSTNANADRQLLDIIVRGKSGNIIIDDTALILDNYTTPNIIYVGKSATGSLTSGAVWQIKKIDKSSGIIIKWANGNSNYENIWDNRVSLTYS